MSRISLGDYSAVMATLVSWRLQILTLLSVASDNAGVRDGMVLHDWRGTGRLGA